MLWLCRRAHMSYTIRIWREVVKEWLPPTENQTGSHAQTPISKPNQHPNVCNACNTARHCVCSGHLVNIAQTLPHTFGTRAVLSFTTWQQQRPTACSWWEQPYNFFITNSWVHWLWLGWGVTHAVQQVLRIPHVVARPSAGVTNSKTSPALLSTKVEYMACTCAAQEAIWLRQTTWATWIWTNFPTSLLGDNQGAIALAKNPGNHLVQSTLQLWLPLHSFRNLQWTHSLGIHTYITNGCWWTNKRLDRW